MANLEEKRDTLAAELKATMARVGQLQKELGDVNAEIHAQRQKEDLFAQYHGRKSLLQQQDWRAAQQSNAARLEAERQAAAAAQAEAQRRAAAVKAEREARWARDLENARKKDEEVLRAYHGNGHGSQ